MIKRQVEDALVELATQYRVVTVIGPRQAGKSTLCKKVFPKKPVVNLEDPEIRNFAEQDPKALLSQYPDGCFIDEVQRCPDLLSYIQIIVDKADIPGQFILSGSHQLLLMNSVSQSLAGRTAIVKLLPLSFEEVEKHNRNKSVDEILFRGSYPEIVEKSLQPSQALSFYVQTYLERDVRELQAVRDLSLFQNFMKLIAGRSGSILNISSLGNELGVSEGTVRNWLSVAEASFFIFRLKPYYKNFHKRQVKSSKIYLYDTGLLCYLLGIQSSDQLTNHPLRGAIFETYVVSESIKYLWNRVKESNLYFYADNVIEIDMIVDTAMGLLPIEIKSAATFRPELLNQLNKATSRLPQLLSSQALVYGGDSSSTVNETKIIPVSKLNELGAFLSR